MTKAKTPAKPKAAPKPKPKPVVGGIVGVADIAHEVGEGIKALAE